MTATLLRTGKQPATEDPRDLLFASYAHLATVLPRVPSGDFGHERSVPQWAMLGNGPDESVRPGFEGAGDCVWAGAAHETMLWQHETPGTKLSAWTGGDVIKDYSAATGYVVGDDSTDQGTNVRDAMKYRQKTGIIDHAGHRHKIAAYVALEPGNLAHLYAALWLFGVVGIGIRFPDSAMRQFDANQPWSPVTGEPDPTEGHYIPLVSRRSGRLDCVTWAKVQQMTVRFYEQYCDEAWVPLSSEHVHGGKSPEGFNIDQLRADLGAVKG